MTRQQGSKPLKRRSTKARSPKQDALTFELRGDDIVLSQKAPNDSVALSWATGVLCFREGDNRPGTEVPVGDYILYCLGATVDEPVYRLRKHDGPGVVASWEAA